MKTISAFILALVLLMTHACTPNDEYKVQKQEKSTFEVCSIHQLEIKPDVDLKEFEAFVINELAPIYNKMKGQHFTLVKGDRGLRTDKYAIILSFETLEDRNRIYPPSGEFVGDFGEKAIWDKFGSMVQIGLGEAHTDYLKLGQ